MRYKINYELIPNNKIKLKKQIKAMSQSIYRMNASTSDCYAFNYYLNNNNKIDFEGGYDWQNGLIDDNATHIYNFKDQKFYKIVSSEYC